MSNTPTSAAQVAADLTDYKPGEWYEARAIEEMQAFYLSRLPAIREAAKEHGYAIGVHGSERRDFDLIAMQWREEAADKDALAHAIAMAACGITRSGHYQWEKKPSGRFAVSIPICWTDHSNPEFNNMPSLGHIDLSVIDVPKAAESTNDDCDHCNGVGYFLDEEGELIANCPACEDRRTSIPADAAATGDDLPVLPEPIAHASKGITAFFVKWAESANELRGGFALYTAKQVEQIRGSAITPYAERIRQLERELEARAKSDAGITASGTQSIGDDPKFRELLEWVVRNVGEPQKSFHLKNLIAYIDGRTAGAAWASVDDERKPEAGKPILLFVRTLTRGEDDEGRPYETEGAQVEMGEYRANNGNPYFNCYVSPISDSDWVTHWMPLPAAPSQPKE